SLEDDAQLKASIITGNEVVSGENDYFAKLQDAELTDALAKRSHEIILSLSEFVEKVQPSLKALKLAEIEQETLRDELGRIRRIEALKKLEALSEAQLKDMKNQEDINMTWLMSQNFENPGADLPSSPGSNPAKPQTESKEDIDERPSD
ncbi:MAG: hypothetical protein JKY60_10680, partial [Kordiimonadaceae bacterium]|nr:hypothetical protein [Kordiimonadaceae bacterium]